MSRDMSVEEPVTDTPGGTAVVDETELAERSAAFEVAPASAVVRWAWERFGDGLVLSASFQDCVLIDLATRVAPDIEVVFLDTGYHFPETIDYVEEVRRRYDLNLRVLRPAVGPDDRWRFDPNGCCRTRKVEPLERALEGRAAWMTGLRRQEAPTRAGTPIVTYDRPRRVVKVNPLATWTDDDVEAYIADHRLPVHPLATRGYRSIGCWPCTRAVADTEHARAGRWAGLEKTECGLHL